MDLSTRVDVVKASLDLTGTYLILIKEKYDFWMIATESSATPLYTDYLLRQTNDILILPGASFWNWKGWKGDDIMTFQQMAALYLRFLDSVLAGSAWGNGRYFWVYLSIYINFDFVPMVYANKILVWVSRLSSVSFEKHYNVFTLAMRENTRWNLLDHWLWRSIVTGWGSQGNPRLDKKIS